MKLALIGYGKMGQEIEKVVTDSKEHEIISVSFREESDGLDLDGIKKADVAVDFTSPEIIMDNIRQVSDLGINMVVGTTGWYDQISEVENMVKKSGTGLIYSQNFSIGANIFFDIVKYASNLISRFDGYDVFGQETHHVGKKDSPSGTARKISEIILKNYPSKKVLQTEALDRPIRKEELHFTSVRGGRNFGRHEVAFDSEADEIRLTHQAWGRRGFAAGAVRAAEYIKDRKGFYNFSDIFTEVKE